MQTVKVLLQNSPDWVLIKMMQGMLAEHLACMNTYGFHKQFVISSHKNCGGDFISICSACQWFWYGLKCSDI
jgi:hypothetical protein